jgi:hypothetical protein
MSTAMTNLQARLKALKADKATATPAVALTTGGATFSTESLIQGNQQAAEVVAFASASANNLNTMYGCLKQVESKVKEAKKMGDSIYAGVFSFGQDQYVTIGTDFTADSQDVDGVTITPRRFAGLVSQGALMLFNSTNKTVGALTSLANLINPYGIYHGFDVDVAKLADPGMQFILKCKMVTTIGFDAIVPQDPATAFAIAKYRLQPKNIVPLKLHGGIPGAELLGGIGVREQQEFLKSMPNIYTIIKDRGMHRVESKTFKEGSVEYKFEQLGQALVTLAATKKNLEYLAEFAKPPAQTKTIREAKIGDVLALLDVAGTAEMGF